MPSEQVSEDLSSGVRATIEERGPFGVHVTWINWDSPFRETGLAIGDRIVAVDGERLEAGSEEIKRRQHVGSFSEQERWKKRGAREGQAVVLTVLRRGEEVEVSGALRAKRSWRSDDNRPLLAPDGPVTISNDGFAGGWGGWYEKLVERLSITLDGSWRHRIDNRARLRDLLAEKPRVDALCTRWPGNFANILAADFSKAANYLEGRTHQVTAADLEYRGLGAARAAQIREAAKTARAAFIAKLGAEVIPLFPAGDAMSISVREKVAGKYVVLPPFGKGSQWIEGRRHWYAAGDARQGYYFVDVHHEAMERAFSAQWRFMKLIDPKPKYPYAIIGRIGPGPKMVAKDGRAYTGFDVEPVAITFGSDELFVDLTERDGDESRYAGEPIAAPLAEFSPTLSPAQLIDLFFAALKRGDQQTWNACFATWEVRNYGPDRIFYSPQAPTYPPALEREWVRARELIQGPVYDVRVAAVDPPELMVSPSMLEGAPLVEQVLVEVDHIGLIDGVHRAYADNKTHRLWPLQRRDGGPWRIAIHDQGI